MPSAPASKTRKSRRTASKQTPDTLPGLLEDLQALQSQAQNLIHETAASLKDQNTNEPPIVLKIPAGRSFHVIQVPNGVPFETATAPTKFTPETFAQALFQAANDLNTQESLSEAFNLAARRGLNIIRFTSAANGVLYHSHNAYMKMQRESAGRKVQTHKTTGSATPPVHSTPTPTTAPAQPPAAAKATIPTEFYPGMREDINLLRAHVKLSITTKKTTTPSNESTGAFARLMGVYKKLKREDRDVFENYCAL